MKLKIFKGICLLCKHATWLKEKINGCKYCEVYEMGKPCNNFEEDKFEATEEVECASTKEP